jgi:hypothetical protein
LFEEVIDNLLLSLDLSVHLIKLLLEPVQLQVRIIKIPDNVDGRRPFGVLAKGLAALAGLVVLFAVALVDLVDIDFQLGL